LLVAIGDQVVARQPIIVVEAMKMENELRSPKAGRVKEIAVAAGDPVDAGRMLVLVE
jgi:biotin carboxyl carrier protein